MQNPTAMLHLNVVMEKPSIQTRETPPPPLALALSSNLLGG